MDEKLETGLESEFVGLSIGRFVQTAIVFQDSLLFTMRCILNIAVITNSLHTSEG